MELSRVVRISEEPIVLPLLSLAPAATLASDHQEVERVPVEVGLVLDAAVLGFDPSRPGTAGEGRVALVAPGAKP